MTAALDRTITPEAVALTRMLVDEPQRVAVASIRMEELLASAASLLSKTKVVDLWPELEADYRSKFGHVVEPEDFDVFLKAFKAAALARAKLVFATTGTA